MKKSQIESIYPLSPTQEGMLFHTLQSPESGVYFSQLSCLLEGELDATAFKRTWQLLTDRHSILRTAFLWERFDQPFQLVFEGVQLPIDELDWRKLSVQQQEEQLEAYLESDRSKGFALTDAPLMRIGLIRMERCRWQFVWSVHHLLLDGWSVALLLKEAFACYEAQGQGRDPLLQPSRPFRDYIAWLKGQDFSRADSFWQQMLGGFAAATPLGVTRSRSGLPSAQEEFADLKFSLPVSATAALNWQARRHQLTLNTLVQGAWALLLSRYSGHQDVLFGITVSGRPAELERVESMVGLFINSLPVRVQVADGQALLPWLEGLQALVAEMRQYEHSSLAELHKWSDVPPASPLFESLLDFENFPVDESLRRMEGNLSVLQAEWKEKTNYPLALLAGPGATLSLQFIYDRSLFDAHTMRRMQGHLQNLLESMAGDPGLRLGELTILSSAELHQLREWGCAPPSADDPPTVQEIFEAQAASRPDAVAATVAGEASQWSYGELNARSNQLAHRLAALEADSEPRVGVLLERSFELLAGLLGILKAGGCYVPLDPDSPARRLEGILQEADASALLTQGSLPGDLQPQAAPLRLDDWQGLTAEQSGNPERRPEPGSLAYVIYTSGSTGRPKGVMVPHSALSHYLQWCLGSYVAPQGAGSLAHSSVAFDLSVTGLFTPLLSGQTVRLSGGGEGLARALQGAGGQSLLKLTPAHLSALPHLLGDARPPAEPSVLVVGGEQLTGEQLAYWRLSWPGTRIVNEYGPTEATVGCCVYELGPSDPLPSGPVPIGRPIPGTRLHILGRRWERLPAGVAGQLLIAGAGLARGYLGQPSVTAEAFVPDPFCNRPGGRLYRTGDQARWRAGGNIEFLGRIDDQVKVRGYRVEPGEVEAVLSRHRSVRQAAVIARPDPSGSQRLVAYVVARRQLSRGAKGRRGFEEGEVRSFLLERLPEFMLPSFFVTLKRLPLTTNGKLDRRRLLQLAETKPDRASTALMTPTEELLAGIWGSILGTATVGREDDFFNLGGHSLLATQVVSRIRRAFAIEMQLEAIFQSPSLKALAREIDQSHSRQAGPSTEPIRRQAQRESLPLSFAQQRLWFLDRLEPEGSHYNIATGVRLEGPLNTAALQAALEGIVHRHEVLRTTFPASDGLPTQVVQPAQQVPLPVADLRDCPQPRRNRELERLAGQLTDRPFNLAKEPLFRICLVRLGEEEHALTACLHHIVSDDWSTGILLQELSALYRAFSDCRPSPLQEIPIQYADFAHWQRQRMSGALLEEQLGYWKEKLAGGAVLELPTDHPRPAQPSHRGASLSFVLPASLLEGLTSLSRRMDVTLYMTLLAAFQALLFRYTGQSDVSVGSPIANRNRSETEGLIGFFVNTLVLRSNLSGGPGFRQLLRRVRQVALGAYAHQDVPFEQVVEALQPERSLSRAPLYQAVFVLQNAPRAPLRLPGLRAELLEVEGSSAADDLWLALAEEAEGLAGAAVYNLDLFEAPTVRRLLAHFRALLESALRDPGQSIACLPLLSPAERSQLLVQWNPPQEGGPAGGSAERALEEWAAEAPDSLAAFCGGGQLSCGGLLACSRQASWHLGRLGVGPETLVGLCMEGSLEMLAGLLGILSSGAAALFLDAGLPLRRLAYLIEEAGAPIVLSQQRLADRLPGSAWTICLDRDWPEVAAAPPRPAASSLGPGQRAYVIYTSGSTGRPKGVEATRGGLANLIQAQRQALAVPAGSRTLQFASLSFDASLFEVALALGARAALCLQPKSRMRPGAGLDRLLRREGIGTVTLPPSVLALLDPEGLPALQRVVAAGEACPGGLARRWATRVRFFNAYGPTETTVWATVKRCGGGPGQPSIGRPVPRFQALVLDAAGQLLPAGVPGELCLGGAGLARGYLGQPALTACQFVPHPWAARRGARLYRTGDRVRLRGDGQIDFLGRIDHQIKLRGCRIEPGEVEAALGECPGVCEALVMLTGQGEPGGERLTAYLAGDLQRMQPEDLRKRLRQRLPEYILPAAFVLLEEFPRTPSGKADRRALAERQAAPRSQQHEPPRTPTEQLLAQAWQELLGLERVGRGDDFFELGGHSLLATRLVSRLQQQLGLELPLQALFEAPRLADLARRLEKGLAAVPAPAPPLRPRPRRTGLPLSFAQQRLWFLDQLEPHSPLYNIPLALRLKGRLRADALQAALSAIAARHEVLRTCFPARGGKPAQKIRPAGLLPLPRIDLRALPPAGRTAQLDLLLARHSARPFDLASGPLVRLLLIRLGRRDQVLAACMHHIVSDGWSMGILVGELAALYRAACRGKPSPLPPLPLQYADFACWQRRQLQGAPFRRQIEFWKEALHNAPALELPTDHPRPARQTFRGAIETFCWPADLAKSLNGFSRSCKATLFMTLLAAFQTLLYRCSGQKDLSLGSPLANRTRAETEGLIGFFVNTLVLRTDLSGSPTIRQLTQRVRETSLSAFAHQDVPFEQLVEVLQPERSLSRAPLFQVMFALQNAPAQALQLPGLDLAPMDVEEGASRFDLTLAISEEQEGLQGEMEYSLELYEPTTIRRMLSQLRILIEAAAADPECRIEDLPLLDAGQRHQILSEWNDSRYDFQNGLCIHHLLEAQSERGPDGTALSFGDEALSYAELNRRGNRLARRLMHRGAGPEKVIGLCLDRSLEMVVGLLGILKSGSAYLGLDPAYPSGRLSLMLNDSRAKLLLTRPGLAGQFAGTDRAAICLTGRNATAPSPRALEAGNPVSGVQPGNPAYVIYTSGSTGAPKGVVIPHRALVNFTRASIVAYGLEAGDRLLQFSSISFDQAGEEIYPCLSLGGTLTLRSEGFLDSIPGFLSKCRDAALTVLNLPTAFWSQIALDTEPHSPALPASLRVVAVGGEKVLARHVQQWWKRTGTGPRPRLIDGYGPTESTVAATACTLQPQGGEQMAAVPIGRPIPNLQTLVLDRSFRPLPGGIPGELHIGGKGLARGYLRAPALTAVKFIPNAFSTDLGARLYRSGDLVRYLADGNLEFLGRIDQQVKVRGYRIEPGEIEAALSRYPSLAECAVLAYDEPSGQKRLVGYVVEAEGSPRLSPSRLREFLLQSLPEYMVPSIFLTLDALPITPQGKVDRKVLLDRFSPQPTVGAGPPSTPSEELLAGMWCEVLGLEAVGRQDNFFELGGHSLLATQVVSRIRRAFQVEIPVRTLFESPRLSELAVRIEQARSPLPGSAAGPISRSARPEDPPLSFAQQRLWILDQLESAGSAYNVSSGLRLKGRLDIAALQAALNEVVRRHEALRTSFPAVEGKPVQVIAECCQLPLPLIDLSGEPSEGRERNVRQMARRESQRPFDLANGRLIRAWLVRLDAEEHLLLATMHHIVSDQWSAGILAAELAAAYPAAMEGRPSPLPELPIQYADFATWQRQRLSGALLEEQLGYWRNRLQGAALLELPLDRPRPALTARNGRRQSFLWPPQLGLGLNTLGRAEDCTLFMTLLAAFQVLLGRWSGQLDVSVGTPIANRNRAETEGLIGFFVNTLVMRTDLSGNPGFRELLDRLRETALDAYAYQDVPFEHVVEALQPERSLNRSPLFQVLFDFHNAPGKEPALPGLQVFSFHEDAAAPKYDLSLLMSEEDGGGLSGVIEYGCDLFEHSSMERFLKHYRILAEAVVSQPEQGVSTLPLLSPAERHQMLLEWNDTARAEFPTPPLPQLFEANLAAISERVAAVCGNGQMTFGQLNRSANQLARHLQGLGIGPEVVVGICVERSLEMLTGLLSILKAGGAYLPLDPSYPLEQLGWILKDAGPAAVLAQEQLSERLPSDLPWTICLDRDHHLTSAEESADLGPASGPANLAYLIYTSGSTGRPKGVAVTQAGLARYLSWCADSYWGQPGRGVPLHSSLSFDLTVTGIWSPLLQGERIDLLPVQGALEALSERLAQPDSFSLIKLTPTHLSLIASRPAAPQQGVMIVGGEALHGEDLAPLLQSMPKLRLFNEYGPTEAVVGCCVHSFDAGQAVTGPVPIGRPITNSRLYLADPFLQAAGIGQTGEIFIGGLGLARGYWHRPGRTAQSLIPDPFSSQPGARLYRSGDLARWRSDGNLEYLGRNDHQVNLRGYRIELGEIESALVQHPKVTQCAVTLRGEGRAAKRLTAYLASPVQDRKTVEEVRAFVKAKLPAHMVPADFVLLESLPLTPNGKVDRRRLPSSLPKAGADETPSFQSPSEEILSGIWKDLLGVERAGRNDHFFDLGGHSLLGTQLVSRIRQAFGCDLDLQVVFDAPRLKDMCRRILKAQSAGKRRGAPPLARAPRGRPVPLSFAQQRLWFLDQMEPANPLYNIPMSVRLSGLLELNALAAALNEIVRRHEVLRTCFEMQDGQPVQRVLAPPPAACPLVDLSARPPQERESELKRLARQEALQPFDLARGPLIRVCLVRLQEQDHALIGSLHHIASDDWSAAILVRELGSLYEAFSQGLPSPLPELPIQYADFALWQREWLSGEALHEQLDYWKSQLLGAPQHLELAADHPRPALPSRRGAGKGFGLSKQLTESLKLLSRRQDCTLYMTLLAGFKALLYRYSGRRDMVVGSPITNRVPAELEGLIGLFVNTVALRTRIEAPRPSFRELLAQVRQAALGAYAHQSVPFEKVVDAQQPDRSLSSAPLFQVMFALQNAPGSELRLAGLVIRPLEEEVELAQRDLTLILAEGNERLEGRCTYACDLFQATTIDRMLGHFETLLTHAAARPDAPLEALPLLSAPEEEQLLRVLNATRSEFPRDCCVHHLFEGRAAQLPDRIALDFEDGQFSYASLDRRSRRVAGLLRLLGVGPEAVVALLTDRNAEMAVNLLGILKAGAAYLPLDPAQPVQRISFVLKDSKAIAAFVRPGQIARLLKGCRPTACLNPGKSLILGFGPVQGGPTQAPDIPSAQNLAYVIYTSGSTGLPKGVSVSHRAVLRLVVNTDYVRLGAGDSVAQASTPAFDAATFEIWGSLLQGARLQEVTREVLLSPTALAEQISQRGINTLFLTTALFNQIARQAPRALGRLDHMLFGGEAVEPHWVRQVLDRAPPRRLLHVYGPTECTTFATWHGIEEDSLRQRTVPIGLPIANTTAYLLDGGMNLLPLGIPGELCLGGPGLARGYLNRPAVTAGSFVPHPFSAGERLYRTGDRVRRNGQGALEFLGRLDDQVKVRGFRIEPGEVEAVLSQHPSLESCTVQTFQNAPGQKRLAAYFVPRGARPAGLTASRLRQYLKSRLPDYMVPSAFVQLESMPLNANGKVDRAALPPPPETRPQQERPYLAPRSLTETRLAEIWRQILKVGQVGVEDNFFELGGDSILSIQIVARANQAGLRLTAQQVFQHQTIAELASVVGSAAHLQAEQQAVSGEVPLTPIQHWFFEQEPTHAGHWNQSVLLEVEEDLSPDILHKAVQHLAGHHDALRMRFLKEGPSWKQLNLPAEELPVFTRLDLSSLPRQRQSGAVEQAAGRMQASLDLEYGPLLRTAAFRLGEGQPGRLLIVIHHLVVDGVSWRILLEDFQACCRLLRQARPISLPPKTTSYKQWSEQLADHALSEAAELEVQGGFWSESPDQPAPPLPVDFRNGVNTEASALSISTSLSRKDTDALLSRVPQAYRTRIDDVLLTALLQTLLPWVKSDWLWIDLEGHGRQELFEGVDLSRTVGWFTCIAPTLLRLDPSQRPGQALKSVKEQLRRSSKHAMGYGLLRFLGNSASIRSRLERLHSQVSFNYLGQFDQLQADLTSFRPAQESSGPERSLAGIRPYLLDVGGSVAEGRLQMTWTYSSRLHRRRTIGRLARNFQHNLLALIAHCCAPQEAGYTPSDFPLARLSQKELDRLLGQDRQVEDLYPLSPLQQGMLFHSLYQPRRGEHLVQTACRLESALNAPALRQAWDEVMRRHSILRSSFRWEGLDQPLQVVRQGVRVPWREEDWRDLPDQEQQRRLENRLEEDRRRGFELDKAPLMRLRLIQLGENSFQFIWSYHHLLLDGWSKPLLLKEVFTLYEAACRGRASGLKRSRPYREYIAWLQSLDPGLSRAEHFWRGVLGGFSAPTSWGEAPLPPTGREDGFAEQRRVLSGAATNDLKRLAQGWRLTLNTLVQGALALVLSRYSGDDEVVFGVTSSGRPPALEGVEGMVGMFINTLPLRVPTASANDLLPWLRDLQGRLAEMRHYEYSPLADVQRWSGVPAGQPLFETISVYENYPTDDSLPQWSEALKIRRAFSVERTNYPLTLLAGADSGLALRISHALSRFESSAMRRMLHHLLAALESMAAKPAKRLGEISLLSPSQRHQLLLEWNDTAEQFEGPATMQQLFESQASRTPDSPALFFEEETWTYRYLDSRANRLAHYLVGLGVRADQPVGILMERSLEMVAGLLGILKAGGAYLPLDPSYPPQRLEWMLQDARAGVILTQPGLTNRVPDQQARLLHLGSAWKAIGREGSGNPFCRNLGGNLAYAIFTSGSTGRPKGSMIPHSAVRNRLLWMQSRYHLDSRDRILQKTPFSFDVSVWEFFWPLMSGAGLVVARPEGHKDPEYLIRIIRERRITRLHFVPSMLQAFLANDGLSACTSVRQTVCSGEALPPDLQQRFFERLPWSALDNLYGPTEAAVDVTFWRCRPQDNRRAVPIGRPISAIRLHLLDRDLAPVPLGMSGELHIGGIGLARGYLGQPAQTADRFIPDPCGTHRGARLYKTGDLARFRPQGEIDFLGRIDFQVKLRGFRVELGEIEARLSEHPALSEAVAMIREDSPGNRRLVAYLTLRDGEAPTSAELKQHLGASLPPYMVPSAFVMLDKLPLSPNGKLDRKALPTPHQASQESLHPFLAPATPLQELLAGFWCEILGVERVGRHDNFFDMGGHSLLATQVVSRISRNLQVRLDLRTVFEAPTLAALAERVEEARQDGRWKPAPPIRRVVNGKESPLSFAQQRLWFLDQLEPASAVYNIPLGIRMKGTLNRAALEQSLDRIVQRHEVLRTSFPARLGKPFQLVRPAEPFNLPLIDLQACQQPFRQRQIQMLADQANRPFVLASDPLFRVWLVRLAPDEHALLACMHHIISDEWSAGVLVRELSALYKAFSQGRPCPLPELPVQYSDFARWQRQRLQGSVLDRLIGYWKNRLRDVPDLLELPTDRPRPALQTYRGAVASFALSKELSHSVQGLSRRYQATLFMTLLAAFQTLLARWSGCQDVCVGVPIANRNQSEIEGLIGFFVNTLALRTRCSGDLSFGALLGQVRQETLDAYAHQDLPFEQVVDALQLQRSPRYMPLVQVFFSLQNAMGGPMELPGLSLGLLASETPATKRDLTLEMREEGERISGLWTYNVDLFSAATIQWVTKRFKALLRIVTQRPEARLDELEKEYRKQGSRQRRDSKLERLLNIQPRKVGKGPQRRSIPTGEGRAGPVTEQLPQHKENSIE